MKDQFKKWFAIKALSRNEADIYLYGAVAEWDEVNAAQFAIELNKASKIYFQINIHINSPGGSIFEGLAIYNLIKQSKVNIDTYVDGIAASMGSVLALAGRRVFMSQNSRLMIHEPLWGEYTTADKLREMATLMDSLKGDIADIYAKKSGKTKQWVLENWMSGGKDNWFTPEEAKAAGLIDGIFVNDAKQPNASMRGIKSIAAHYSNMSPTEYERMWKTNITVRGKVTTELALLKESNPAKFISLQAEYIAKIRQGKR